MPYVKYDRARKLEAVALARVIGSEAAAEQLGMDKRAVRDWLDKAGDGPELAADKATWRGLMDLALSRTQALVAGGKLSPTTIATIAGIAARNAHRDVQEPDEPRTDAEAFVDELEAWAAAERPDLLEEYEGARVLAGAVLRTLLNEPRLRRQDALMRGEDPPDDDEDAFDTGAFLAGFSQAVLDEQQEREATYRAWVEARIAESKVRNGVLSAQPVADDLDALLAEADALLAEVRA